MKPRSGSGASVLIPIAIRMIVGMIVRMGSNINSGSYVRSNIATGDTAASAIGTAGPVKSYRAATRCSAANLLYRREILG
jgi:hypothetical protein